MTLSFEVLPCASGELKFSDGSRLLARDLSEMWGAPVTRSQLFGEDFRKWPVTTSIVITSEDLGKKAFLKDEEYCCGFAYFRSHKDEKELIIYISVEAKVFEDFLRVRSDLPAETHFDIEIRGLKDESPVYDANHLQGTWYLDDISDCGYGDHRIVTGFYLERVTPFFA